MPPSILAQTKTVSGNSNRTRQVATYTLSAALPQTDAPDLLDGIKAWERMQFDLIVLDITSGVPAWLDSDVLSHLSGYGVPLICDPKNNAPVTTVALISKAQNQNTRTIAQDLNYVI